VDGELPLSDVTPELFQALALLEPYGMGNPEPVFSTRGVQLVAPPRILKDKHAKLKLRAGEIAVASDEEELSAAAIMATPRCHPDSAAIRRSEREGVAASVTTENRELRTDFRSRITFDALGWHMAERVLKHQLLAGDSIDIAFTIGNNDHPEYGGLELTLRDFKTSPTKGGNGHPAAPSPR
jgi:single-stranded-DNA-specific exonuclease